MADAGLLGISDGFHGAEPVMAIYQARFNRYLEDRGLKPATDAKVWPIWVTARRRTRIARSDHAGIAREARQFDFCHQLQFAAPGRSGERQRTDYSGTRIGVPRRALERDQGFVGQRVGPHFRARHRSLLVKRMGELVDGEYQKLVVSSALTFANISSAVIRGC